MPTVYKTNILSILREAYEFLTGNQTQPIYPDYFSLIVLKNFKTVFR